MRHTACTHSNDCRRFQTKWNHQSDLIVWRDSFHCVLSERKTFLLSHHDQRRLLPFAIRFFLSLCRDPSDLLFTECFVSQYINTKDPPDSIISQITNHRGFVRLNCVTDEIHDALMLNVFCLPLWFPSTDGGGGLQSFKTPTKDFIRLFLSLYSF